MRFLVLIFLLLPNSLFAQVNHGARFTGMAQAGAALQGIFSLSNNQSGIASVENSNLALDYTEHFYASSSRTFTALTVIPSKWGNFGLLASKYNLKNNLSEFHAGVTYARMIKSRLATAITINHHRLPIAEYSKMEDLSIDLGMQYWLKKNWVLGFHLANIRGIVSPVKTDYVIASQLRLGMSYLFNDIVLLSMESEFDSENGYDYKLGLEYSILDWMKLRGGVSVSPFQNFMGAGFEFRNFRLDLASAFHPQLGVSPQSSLSYAF